MKKAGDTLKDTNLQDLWYAVRKAQVPNTIQEKSRFSLLPTFTPQLRFNELQAEEELQTVQASEIHTSSQLKCFIYYSTTDIEINFLFSLCWYPWQLNKSTGSSDALVMLWQCVLKKHRHCNPRDPREVSLSSIKSTSNTPWISCIISTHLQNLPLVKVLASTGLFLTCTEQWGQGKKERLC